MDKRSENYALCENIFSKAGAEWYVQRLTVRRYPGHRKQNICKGCENEIIDVRLVKEFAKADFTIELHYEQNPQVLQRWRIYLLQHIASV